MKVDIRAPQSERSRSTGMGLSLTSTPGYTQIAAQGHRGTGRRLKAFIMRWQEGRSSKRQECFSLLSGYRGNGGAAVSGEA